MSPKRKNSVKKKSIEAVSVANNNPCDEFKIPDVSTLNRSEAAAAILMASYTFAKNFLGIRDFTQKQKKQLTILLREMHKLFADILHSTDPVIPNDVIAISQAYYYAACVFCPFNLENAEKIAKLFIARSGFLLYEDFKPQYFMTAMRVFDVIGSLFLKLKSFQLLIRLLEDAVRIFMIYKERKDPSFISNDIKCLTKEEEEMAISKRLFLIFERILHNLITVCRTEEFKESHKFKVLDYEHMLLELYLENSIDHNNAHSFIVISLNLAKSLLMLDFFTEAKDHIAMACFILEKFFNKANYQQGALGCPKCQDLIAQINLMWAYYGIRLLLHSRNLYMRSSNFHSGNTKSTLEPKSRKTWSTLLFTKRENYLKDYNSLFTDISFSNYNSVREGLVSIFKFLCVAKTFNTGKINDMHIKVLLHIVEAYKLFAHYEAEAKAELNLYLWQKFNLNYISEWFKKERCADHLFKITFLEKALLASNTYQFSIEWIHILNEIKSEKQLSWKKELDFEMASFAKISISSFKLYLNNSKKM